MNTKRIYKVSMAEFLIDHGCTLVKQVPDLLDPKKTVWLFEDTEEVRELMTEYTARLKGKV